MVASDQNLTLKNIMSSFQELPAKDLSPKTVALIITLMFISSCKDIPTVSTGPVSNITYTTATSEER